MPPVLSPFAALEASVDAGVIAALANATAALAGGLPVGGIFEREYQRANVGDYGMASAGPSVTVATNAVPPNPYGVGVVIAGAAAIADNGAYTVRETHPDGALTVLLLERAP